MGNHGTRVRSESLSEGQELLMYTFILVPFDGSAFGERALPIALALGQRSGARIELVHAHERNLYPSGAPVYDPRLDEEFRTRMQKELESLADRLRKKTGLAITTRFLEGRVADALREYLASSGADLVVMTTHGYGGLSRAWLGSVADHLVRHSNVPILLVRPGAIGASEEPLFRRILVPLDGSSVGEAALDHAVMLGTPGATEYLLLEVVVPRPIAAYPYPTNLTAADEADLGRRQTEARAYLERVRTEFLSSGFATRCEVVAHRQVARGILEAARAYGTDLIALSTHGRGAVSRLLPGSVADKILRAATTPLLLYHPPRASGEQPAWKWEEDAAKPTSSRAARTPR